MKIPMFLGGPQLKKSGGISTRHLKISFSLFLSEDLSRGTQPNSLTWLPYFETLFLSVTIRNSRNPGLEFLRSVASSVSISEERRLDATHHFVKLSSKFAPWCVPKWYNAIRWTGYVTPSVSISEERWLDAKHQFVKLSSKLAPLYFP